ncbi:CBS domain-containing protein [Solitalea sp. MAHUQ-68]|uniref:CBS domain-containing protein n=1 Tax=Solitalea agri TaxID=2953739 RepID=A0A9X2F598_9SPHI|nr:CBS domain-containing protein [Solitalea agri]MCO4294480.1 CBS domain-containing protein [Solitalea agri]
MDQLELVSQIMTKTVITVDEQDDLRQVLSLLNKHNVRHIPVKNGTELTGIISKTDINRLTFGAMFENQEDSDEAILELLSIPQVMTSKPRTITSDTSIKHLAEIFAKEEYHALPVVDHGVLMGIVTTTDVIKYLLDQYNS